MRSARSHRKVTAWVRPGILERRAYRPRTVCWRDSRRRSVHPNGPRQDMDRDRRTTPAPSTNPTARTSGTPRHRHRGGSGKPVGPSLDTRRRSTPEGSSSGSRPPGRCGGGASLGASPPPEWLDPPHRRGFASPDHRLVAATDGAHHVRGGVCSDASGPIGTSGYGVPEPNGRPCPRPSGHRSGPPFGKQQGLGAGVLPPRP